MMKAAIYVRVSTEEQATKGISLEAQKSMLIDFIQSKEWSLYEVYVDGGFSGKNTNRPAFQKMMMDAELRKFDVLVVYKIDRLSRSILDFHKTMEILNKNKVQFVSMSQQFDTTTAIGRLALTILVDFANFEREIDVERSTDIYKQRRKIGVPYGGIPYGYRRENKKIVKVPEEVEIVKSIYSLAMEGYSRFQLAKKFGMTTDKIRSILTNPFYCGYIVRRRDKNNKRVPEELWEWFLGLWEPIISQEYFNEVKELRKKRRPRTTPRAPLFQGLIFCMKCNHNLSFHYRNTKSGYFAYYICDSIKRDGPHCNTYIREEALERIFLLLLDKIYSPHYQKPEPKKIDLAAQIDKKIQKVIKLVADDAISIAEGKEQIGALKLQKASLIASKITKDDYLMVAKKLKSVRKLYGLLPRERKSRLWHIVIDKIDSFEGFLKIKWRGTEKVTKITNKRIEQALTGIHTPEWRREWDLNPRQAINPHTLSRRAP